MGAEFALPAHRAACSRRMGLGPDAPRRGWAPVEGDRVQLQQVILNLALNAVEAMSSVEAGPRELLISTEKTHGNGFSSRSAIPARASIWSMSIAFSKLATPRKPAAWGWG
jgi:signal transduction histidine kinase